VTLAVRIAAGVVTVASGIIRKHSASEATRKKSKNQKRGSRVERSVILLQTQPASSGASRWTQCAQLEKKIPVLVSLSLPLTFEVCVDVCEGAATTHSHAAEPPATSKQNISERRTHTKTAAGYASRHWCAPDACTSTDLDVLGGLELAAQQVGALAEHGREVRGKKGRTPTKITRA